MLIPNFEPRARETTPHFDVQAVFAHDKIGPTMTVAPLFILRLNPSNAPSPSAARNSPAQANNKAVSTRREPG
jgi:hypothetical protein